MMNITYGAVSENVRVGGILNVPVFGINWLLTDGADCPPYRANGAPALSAQLCSRQRSDGSSHTSVIITL